MSNLFTDLEKARADQRAALTDSTPKPKRSATRKVTPKSTRIREGSRDSRRATSRGKARDRLRDLPTRDEIQEFSFRLRDELKIKVQAEVPHRWQKELEDIARKLDVKKLELYRFILGEFLGKVRRQGDR